MYVHMKTTIKLENAFLIAKFAFLLQLWQRLFYEVAHWWCFTEKQLFLFVSIVETVPCVDNTFTPYTYVFVYKNVGK